jgi:hypothetical protein
MTQYLDKLSQLASAAGVVADLARATLVNRFPIRAGQGVYIHTAHADLHIRRAAGDEVTITAVVQPPFAWQIASDHDDTGVVYAALRQPLIGVVGSARIEAVVPPGIPIVLRLESVRLTQDDLTGMFDLPGA